MKKTILVNLLGAAGAGKSTMAWSISGKLKRKGVNCEYVPEFAKSLVYEKNFKCLEDQLFVFANQYHALKTLRGVVDVIVTDSPLLLSVFYNAYRGEENLRIPNELMEKLVMFCHSTFDNLNFFIERNHEYKKEGRYQTEEEAKEETKIIKEIVDSLVEYQTLPSGDESEEKIVDAVLERLKFYDDLDKSGEEIERKFLVETLPENFERCAKKVIVQAYPSVCGKEVRVRNVDNEMFFRTEKYGQGLVREEFEKRISKEEFLQGLKQAKDRVVMKVRHLVPLIESGKMAEVDIYDNIKFHEKPLQTVEVEFESKEEAERFVKPDWFGEELTGKQEFANSTLARQHEL